MLNLSDLNVFVQAALAENFSLAARRLYMSQPAVSLHIANLERQLGLELFSRTGRAVQLSEAGKVLLPLAHEMLQKARQIEETMWSLKGMVIGHLTLACSTTVGKYILPRLVASFRRTYPDVRVAVNVMSRRAALEALQTGRADIAVVSTKPSAGDIEFAPFLEDKVILLVPAGHPWADGRTVQPEDLLTQPFILREVTAGTFEVMGEGLTAHGLSPSQLNTVLTLGNAEAIEMSVEAGIGIAFVSRLAATRGLALGTVVQVPVAGFDLRRTVYMVRNHRQSTTPLQQVFWDFAFAPEHDAVRRLPGG